MQIKEFGEFTFINSIVSDTIVDSSSVKVGIGDDCAVYTASQDMDQLITTDTMVEGIHFTMQTMRPYDVGFRLMTANISDIAAMGGVPKQAVISVATPKEQDVKDLQCIYDGIKTQCKAYNMNLLGGDTVGTAGPLVLTVTIIGEVPKNSAVLRSGAKIGDWVGVTNTLGQSAVGLDVIAYNEKGYYTSKDAHQRPQPQVELGTFLRCHGAHSMNDISDGLASELHEIAASSKVHICIEKENIPLHDETIQWAKSRQIDPIDFALYGGEDFQLVFTVSEKEKEQLEGHPLLTFIGRVIDKETGVSLYSRKENKTCLLKAKGYQHFTK